jgi:hypothetical protein
MVTCSIGSPSVPFTMPEIVAVCETAAVKKQRKINGRYVLSAFRKCIRITNIQRYYYLVKPIILRVLCYG